jgi:hypothetical protein
MLYYIIMYAAAVCEMLHSAEKQPATNKQALFVDNFGMAPAVIACC